MSPPLPCAAFANAIAAIGSGKGLSLRDRSSGDGRCPQSYRNLRYTLNFGILVFFPSRLILSQTGTQTRNRNSLPPPAAPTSFSCLPDRRRRSCPLQPQPQPQPQHIHTPGDLLPQLELRIWN